MMSKEEEAFKIVKKFIKDNEIGSGECVYQCDWVIEHAYELITDLCDCVGYYEYPDEEK